MDNVKRKIFVSLAVAVLTALHAHALTETVNGITWTYTVSNSKASVGGGSSSSPAVPKATSGAITIPSTLGDYPVTSIGNYAFYYCSKLTSVTIPDSVTSIGSCAFYICRSLSSVTIPDSVTSIGQQAFTGCSGLTSIEIPNSVTSIGQQAFTGCSGLTSIEIPNSITSIADSAFSGCSGLTSVTIPGWCRMSTVFSSSYRNITNAVIASGSTSIAGSAFSGCSGLTSVTIPDSVTSIGSSAFYGCGGMTSFVVDADNPAYCSVNGLLLSKDGQRLINGINGSVTIPSSVTRIVNYAFYNCGGLVSVTIPNSVTIIGYAAFANCSGLTSVTIPDSVTSIGDSAFSYCSGLTSVTIPDSVTSIGSYAFHDCGGMVSFVVDVDNPAYCSMNGLLLSKDGQTLISGINGSVTIPSSVTRIGNDAFLNCGGLVSVTIPNSVTNIEGKAFSGCSSLTSVTVPDSVTSIGDKAFYGCGGMASFVVDVDNPAYCSVSGLLLSKDGQTLINGINGSVTIPDSVTSIGNDAFRNCGGLTSVAIPNSVTNIGSDAFANCRGLASVTVPGWCGMSSVFSSSYQNVTNAVISSGSTSIADSAFSGCSGLKSVAIPNSVTSIGISAFSGCSSLTSVTIPNSVTSIGQQAFSGCSSLTSVTIPDSVTSIGGAAFNNCSGLTSVTIPECCRMSSVFSSSYRNITNAVLASGSTSIAGSAFSGCSGLTSVTIPDSVTSIGDNAFSGCSGLTSIEIPNSVTSIGSYAFYSCRGLTSVTIPDSVTSIGHQAFYFCGGLTSVTIPGWCRMSSVFSSSYRNITNAVIASGSTSIADNAFSGCSGLTSVTIPDSVTSIGDSAFSGCNGLAAVFLPLRFRDAAQSLNGHPADCKLIFYLPFETTATGAERVLLASEDTDWAGASDANGAFARSGAIPACSTSSVETVVSGPGTLKFDWRVSANHGDSCRLYLDGNAIRTLACSSSWSIVGVAIPDGNHLVSWSYERGLEGAAGEDAAFLSHVSWTPMRPHAGGIPDIVTALDCTNLVFTISGGGEYWMPQTDVSHDGVDAVRCDAILTPAQDGFNHTDFALAATVTCPGRLSFWWKVENGGDGGFTFWFGKCNPTNGHYAVLAGLMDNDGVPHYEWRPFDEGGGFSADSVTGGCTDDGEWAKVVCDVGEGEHMFMWSVGTMFGRENGRAYLDEVTWIPAAADAIVIGGVAIPHSWLSDEAAPILAANSGNHETAANAMAANGVNKVWECYVAGISPTNAAARFEARIDFVDGKPVVKWEPDLNEGGTKHERVYTVEGKENLADSWAPANSASRFFRVKVSIP